MLSRLPTLTLLVLLLAAGLNSPAVADEQPPQPIDFAHQVVPILRTHCGECHTGDKSEGGFSFNTRSLLLESEAVVPGQPDQSRLVDLIRSTDPDDQMPPRDRDRLSAAEVDILTRWIAAGADWEAGFRFSAAAYEPPLLPQPVELPPAEFPDQNPIDRLLSTYRRKHELPAPRPVSDLTYLRRTSMDLLGLLPTPEQQAQFAGDQRPDRREQLVDQLLSRDRDYAAHWLTFWNDLLRNDYVGTGYIDGGRKQITGWLYQSLLENKPYDQFVTELIAPPTPESSGFIDGIKWRGNVNASQVREIQFAQNVSQVFLGINMKCASCHDSFIDRWTLDEAYSLAAIYSERELEIHRCDKPTGRIAKAGWLFPQLGTIDTTAEQPVRLQQLAALMTHRDNGRFARTLVNRLWQRLMGRGIVHPVDAMHTEPWNADLLNFLADDLVRHNYNLKRVLRLIITSAEYQSVAVPAAAEAGTEDFVFRGPITRHLTAEQFMDAVWQLTETTPDKIDAPLPAELQTADNTGQPLRPRAALIKSDLLMRSLGRPNREQVVTTRPAELSTLQAIDLANGEILDTLLARGAAAHLSAAGQDPGGFVTILFRHALTREPTATEQSLGLELLGPAPTQESVQDLLWTILMLPEFQFVN